MTGVTAMVEFVPSFNGQTEQIIREQESGDMLTAVGCRLIRLHDSADDVEYGIGAATLMIDFVPLLELNDRRDDGQPGAFFVAEQLTHSSGRMRPRVERPNRRAATVNGNFCFPHSATRNRRPECHADISTRRKHAEV